MSQTLEKDFTVLKPLLYDILDSENFRSVPFIAEELRVEYPEKFAAMMKNFVSEYELSGCGAYQGHINAVSDMLAELAKDNLVISKIESGQTLWKKVENVNRS